MKLINTLNVELRWMDIDAYGHLGNARFYDFMTDLRVDAFKSLGFLDNLSLQFVVAESHCVYKKPCKYPGTLIIKQYCDYVKNSSTKLVYHFFMKDDLINTCAESYAIMVFYNTKTKMASRIPDKMRTILEQDNLNKTIENITKNVTG